MRQGYNVAPVLFLSFINDITDVLESDHLLLLLDFMVKLTYPVILLLYKMICLQFLIGMIAIIFPLMLVSAKSSLEKAFIQNFHIAHNLMVI